MSEETPERVVGFFDVNRVKPRDMERLLRAGWVPVQGDPHRAAACWRRSWVERFWAWFMGR